ncbi:MAG: sigma-70 family RNA polymerase sigma factor [Thermoleophilaceae bacterium]|nr:sigma-70 family RNA polymerase sigma factor [Thermoleophilaceae bacterium]
MSLKRGTGFNGYERHGDDGHEDPARAATLRLVERHGAQVMRTARRYTVTPEDAEDAFQRAVEIMLTKAPDIPDAELLPWLKTVVKHEAFAIRRQEDRSPLCVDGPSEADAAIAAPVPSPIEQSERFERLRLGAEAMRHLKPQEMRAMALLAEGYSYEQICDETGWTYTKVNRCLAEGRQSFLKRVAGIESGAECQRLEPKLSALADGEAGDEDLAVLRRHLRRCSACRATLREQYLAPEVVGALAPTALLGGARTLWERLDGVVTTVKVKTASILRLSGFDAEPGPGQVALSGGSGRVVSIGVAKGLAVLALGGAGVGTVAGVEQMVDPTRPESAQASGSEQERMERRASRRPDSPDPRLVAERLRPHDGGRPAARPRRKQGDSEPPANTASLRSATGSAPARPEPPRYRHVGRGPTPPTSRGSDDDRSPDDSTAFGQPSSDKTPESDERSEDEERPTRGCRHRDDWYSANADPSRSAPWCGEEEDCRHRDDWYSVNADPSRPAPWCPEEN